MKKNQSKTTLIIGIVAVLLQLVLPLTTHANNNICEWGFLESINLNNFGMTNNICQLATIKGGNSGTIWGMNFILELLIRGITTIVVMAALISLVIGGYIYMTAGGSADRVQLAKTWITSAILGLIIALSSWIIMWSISPTLV